MASPGQCRRRNPTLGWDWYLERATGTFEIAGGDVRSNIMAVDATGADIGMTGTAAALAARLADIDRAAAVAASLPGRSDVYHAAPTLQ